MKILNIIFWALPIGAFWAWKWVNALWLFALVFLLLVLRVFIGFVSQREGPSALQRRLLVATCFILAGCGFLGMMSPQWAFKLYPAVVSGVMGGVFIYSLGAPPSLVEQFCGIYASQVSEMGRRYMRKVTIVWGLFCWINMVLSLCITFYGTQADWIFYNGGLSYGLMGLLFALEYGFRYVSKQRVRQEIHKAKRE